MIEEETSSELPIEALNTVVSDVPITFDNYRSVGDPGVMIFVPNDAVPPFRFKAGGWDLLQSSIDLGPAMRARVAERGFFMCRLNEDQSGWTELDDLPVAST